MIRSLRADFIFPEVDDNEIYGSDAVNFQEYNMQQISWDEFNWEFPQILNSNGDGYEHPGTNIAGKWKITL